MLPDGETRRETRSRHHELQHIYEEKKESFPYSLNLRLRRAISWIDRAGRADDDDDSYLGSFV